MNLFEKPRGVQTRWASFENPTAGRNCAGLENKGGKGHPSDSLAAGTARTLLDVTGSGTIRRIWMTVIDRSPEILRGLRIDMFWDGAGQPAMSCPLGIFSASAWDNAFVSNPDFFPIPRAEASIVLSPCRSGNRRGSS